MKAKKKLSRAAVIEVTGMASEGFLNSLTALGAKPVSVKRTDEFTLLVELRQSDMETAKAAAMRSRCDIKIIRDGIISRAAGKFRRRGAAVVLAALIVSLLFWSRSYIWEIEISGNETVSTGDIFSALASCGVEPGAFWPGLSSETIRNMVLEEMPELAWISVNMHGSRAAVEVVERVSPPEMIYKGAAADIVAKKDGFVSHVSAPVGEAAVSRGSAVSAGDLLISGVVESSFAPPTFLRAQGSVIAETFTQIQTVSPEMVNVKIYTGEERSRFSLIIGDKRINFYSNSSISNAKCDTIISVWKAEIIGLFSLPVKLVRQTDRFYETETIPMENSERGLLMDTVLDELLAQSMGEGEVLDIDRESFVSNGLVWRVLRARCLEEIGISQPISSQRMNEANYIYQQKADETNGGTQN